MGQQGFDWSGQVFTETLLDANSPHFNWASKSTGIIDKRFLSRTENENAPSLSDVCERCFLANSSLLTESSLKGVPFSLGSRLWGSLVKNQLQSTRLWQIFTTAYPDAAVETGLKSMVKTIERPDQLPLGVFTRPLGCKDFNWLAVVSLHGIRVSRADMVKEIVGLKNLAALTLGEKLRFDSGDGVDDALLRAWGRHAAEDDSKSVLRSLQVLSLERQTRVTSNCFKDLIPLSGLCLLLVEGCDFRPSSGIASYNSEWKRIEYFPRDDFFWENNGSRNCKTDLPKLTDTALEFAASHAFLVNNYQNDEPKNILDKPRLHLILGSRGFAKKPLSKGHEPGHWPDGKRATYLRLGQGEVTDSKLSYDQHETELCDKPAKRAKLRSKPRDIDETFANLTSK